MLFVTIGILTTGLSMKKSFEEITKKFTPYDLSCSLNKDNEESNILVTDFNKNRNLLGEKELQLNNDEIYLASNLESMIITIERFFK